MARVEQQRMRKALIDAELELQQGAVTTQHRRKAFQASSTPICCHLCHDCCGTYVQVIAHVLSAVQHWSLSND